MRFTAFVRIRPDSVETDVKSDEPEPSVVEQEKLLALASLTLDIPRVE